MTIEKKKFLIFVRPSSVPYPPLKSFKSHKILFKKKTQLIEHANHVDSSIKVANRDEKS
jgi:hypothetical protein